MKMEKEIYNFSTYYVIELNNPQIVIVINEKHVKHYLILCENIGTVMCR